MNAIGAPFLSGLSFFFSAVGSIAISRVGLFD